MAFEPAFTVSQGIDAQNFTVTDTSSGTDANIASRQIFIQLADGTYLTTSGSSTDYIPFPLSDGASIIISGLLTIDYATSIKIKWIDDTGSELYSLTQSYCFVGNDEEFMYGLVQDISSNPNLLQNTDYIFNCFEIDMFTTYAQKAVTTGNDIKGAQNLLDLAQMMINDSSKYW